MTKFLELVLLRSPMGRAPAPGGPSGCSELLDERKWGFTLQKQNGSCGIPVLRNHTRTTTNCS